MLLIIGAGLIVGLFASKKLITKEKKNKEISTKTIVSIKKAINDFKNSTIIYVSKLTKTIDDIPYVVFKRIHSITGTIFIGGFVIAHFINNTLAYNPKKLNKLSKSIHKNPLFPLIEIVGIYIPLTTHIIIGLILLRKGKIDTRIKSETNYRYILQRLSAYIILKTLIFHLVTIRFNEYIPDFIRKPLNIPSKRDLTFQKVNVWFKPPLSLIGHITYRFFIISISYHLSNGLWTAAITWGLAKTYEKQIKLRRLSNWIFAALVLWGEKIIDLYTKEYKEEKEED